MTAAPMMTIYHPDGSEQTLEANAACREIEKRVGWTAKKPPPLNWEREIPKFKVTRTVHPPANSRFKFEPPFSHIADSNEYQYATRVHHAGEVLEIKSWPHPSFQPLNYSAERVIDFFNSRLKSRMALSPWQGDGIRLDDGLSGSLAVQPRTPEVPRFSTQPKPFNFKPAA